MLAALTAWPFLIMTLASFGVDDTATYFVGRRRLTIRRARRLATFAALVCGGATAALALPLEYWVILSSDHLLDILLVTAIAPLFTYYRAVTGLLNARSSGGAWNLCRAAPSVTYLVLVIGLHVLSSLTYRTAVLAWIVAYICGILLALTAMRKADHTDVEEEVTAGQLFTFCTRAGVGRFGSQLAQRGDLALVAVFLPVEALGIYAVASSVAVTPGALLQALASRGLGQLVNMPAQQSQRFEREMLRRSWLVAGALYVGLAAMAPVLVPMLFGDAFAQAVVLVELMAPGALVYFASQASASVIIARGDPGGVARDQVSSALVLAVSVVVLLPHWGAAGAAVASTLAYGFFGLLMWRRLRGRHR